MKEARLIFPTAVGEAILHSFLAQIRAEFGGFTAVHGFGSWMDGEGRNVEEPVLLVDIAYNIDIVTDLKLFEIAKHFAVEGKQDCTYLRYGSGHVQLVACDSEPVFKREKVKA